MENLKFSFNWNGKLNNTCFTTIRLHNSAKYAPGAYLDVYLGTVFKGTAKVIEVRQLKLASINEFIARIDTGYSRTECQEMIKKMYKNSPGIHWDRQVLDFVLLQFEKKEQAKLF